MSDLPPEVWADVFKFCDASMLSALRATCVVLNSFVPSLCFDCIIISTDGNAFLMGIARKNPERKSGIMGPKYLSTGNRKVVMKNRHNLRIMKNKALTLEDLRQQNETGLGYWISKTRKLNTEFLYEQKRENTGYDTTFKEKLSLIFSTYESGCFARSNSEVQIWCNGWSYSWYTDLILCATMINNSNANFIAGMHENFELNFTKDPNRPPYSVEYENLYHFFKNKKPGKVKHGRKFTQIDLLMATPWDWVEFYDNNHKIMELCVREVHHVDSSDLYYNDFGGFTTWLQSVSIDMLWLGGLDFQFDSTDQLKCVQHLNVNHLKSDGTVFNIHGNIDYPVDFMIKKLTITTSAYSEGFGFGLGNATETVIKVFKFPNLQECSLNRGNNEFVTYFSNVDSSTFKALLQNVQNLEVHLNLWYIFERHQYLFRELPVERLNITTGGYDTPESDQRMELRFLNNLKYLTVSSPCGELTYRVNETVEDSGEEGLLPLSKQLKTTTVNDEGDGSDSMSV